MINKFSLSNFKAFGQEQHIPLRPITLIFGANSSGKSSLIHALLLARHALVRGKWDANHVDMAGNSVELGGFANYLHKKGQNPGKAVSFSLCKDLGADAPLQSALLKNVRALRISIAISQDMKGACRLQSCQLDVDGDELFLLTPAQDGQMVFNTWEAKHPLTERIATWVCRRASLDYSEYVALLQDEVSRIISRYATVDSFSFFPERVFFPKDFSPDSGDIKILQDADVVPFEGQMQSVLRRILPAILRDFVAEVHHQFSADLQSMNYLGPLRSYPSRQLTEDEATDPNWHSGGGFAWKSILHDRQLRDKVNAWLSHDKLKSKYRIKVRRLIDEKAMLESLRAKLDEHDAQLLAHVAGWEEQNTALVDNLGLSSLNCRDYLEENPDLLHELIELQKPAFEDAVDAQDLKAEQRDSCLENFAEDFIKNEVDQTGGIFWEQIRDHYLRSKKGAVSSLAKAIVDSEKSAELMALEIADQIGGSRPPEMVLIDERSGTSVTHRDVGVGISQVLPVLAQAFASENRIIAIEQPEIHLHPALQTELGDLFIESALKSGNTFILETHSEHLILRVLRRIRETTRNKLPDGICPINPQDVAVLYVQPSEHGSAIQELRIDEHGRFRDNWPQGFFEDRLDEMF